MTPLATRHSSPATSASMLPTPYSLPRKSSFLPAQPDSLVTRHSSLVTGRRPAAFTLIELLVVIAIIAILAGLAFPAVQGALNSGKKAQARNDVQQIAAAIRAFELEYGRMPTSAVNTGDDGSDFYTADSKDVVKALLGQDPALNPRNIVFLDAKTAKNKKGGVDSSDFTFYDPWGSSYIIKMDNNYNGKTEYYGDRFTKVIVLSPGPNKTPENPSASGNDDIGNY